MTVFPSPELKPSASVAEDTSMRVERVPSPIRAQVADKLRQAICDLRFEPGQRLVERELVELCGVSRTSIREALRELAAEGLVKTIPNKGVIVASVSRQEAEEIYELRSSLEGLAARLFVARGSDEQLLQLEDALKDIERAATEDTSALVAAKDRFYDILFAGAHNEALRAVVSGLHARVSILRATSLSQPGRPRETVHEISNVLVALKARDADQAARLCSWHVEQAGRTSLQAIEQRKLLDGASA